MNYRALPENRIYWAGAMVILIGVVLYFPNGLYFLNDDLIHIPLSSKGVLMQRHSWRPIGDLSIALDWYIWGENAWGYHLSSLLLHGACSALVGAFVNTLFCQYMPDTSNRLVVSWLTSVLFFVYAFHSEAVFWIIGRSASLAMLFGLPAFIFYLKRNTAKRFIGLSLLFFQLAMLAYESVWVFPMLAVLFSAATIYKKGSTWKKEWIYLLVIWASFIIHLFIRFLYLGEVAGNYEGSHFKAFNPYVLALNNAKLLLRTFLPPAQQSWQLVAGTATLFIIVVFVLYRMRKKQPGTVIPIIAGICLFVSYLPYLSLGMDTHGVESERYLYMPSVFAVLLLAWSMVFMFRKYLLPLFLLLATYQLIFLYFSRTYFSAASHISATTFQQVNALTGKKRLFIDSLPDEVRGALIFRLGFTEGLEWLKQSGTVDSVIILSRKRNDIGDEHFAKNEVEMVVNPVSEVSGQLQQYIGNTGLQPGKPNGLFQLNPVTDAYFRYDKGRWLIWK